MKTNRKNQSLLMSTVKVLARDYKKYFISLFVVMTVLYLIGIIVVLCGITSGFGGIEGIYLIACIVAGLFSFKENFVFLAQNQVPKSTMVRAFIIEGLCFGLFTSVAVSIFSHIMQLISSALNGYISSILDLIPTWEKQSGIVDFGRTLVILLFLYVGVYFAGLTLGAINYRLNWFGRIIFWVPFGVISLNGVIGVLQYHLDSVGPEKLEVFSIALAKPFINAFNWVLQSLGNFVIAGTAIIVISIVIGAVVFRGAEVKYSNIK
ncbi:MAG: hypothetical protein GX948_05580 [Clostridiaceae bacterium]|jgi:hypothetical protein|nr:hypothetical protein [Clostridia bacterium]MBP6161379.1 hypothetical protein [Clostridia bacterium]MBP6949516.1 hypothetical protein [Clostridia bacterium]NMA36305.1 hypothetical protein [Clostridiaceae bacterium]